IRAAAAATFARAVCLVAAPPGLHRPERAPPGLHAPARLARRGGGVGPGNAAHRLPAQAARPGLGTLPRALLRAAPTQAARPAAVLLHVSADPLLGATPWMSLWGTPLDGVPSASGHHWMVSPPLNASAGGRRGLSPRPAPGGSPPARREIAAPRRPRPGLRPARPPPRPSRPPALPSPCAPGPARPRGPALRRRASARAPAPAPPPPVPHPRRER